MAQLRPVWALRSFPQLNTVLPCGWVGGAPHGLSVPRLAGIPVVFCFLTPVTGAAVNTRVLVCAHPVSVLWGID